MFEDIKNKSVLVTGVSRGIGQAVSKIFQAQGACVYGVSRSIEVPQENNISNGLGKFVPLKADLLIEEEIYKVASKIDQLDVIVHNAAFFKPSTLTKLTKKEWDQHIMLNLTTPFLLTQALWNKLKKPMGSEASIVFISSLAGVQNKEKFPGTSAYVSAKMGLVGLCEVIAVEGREFNIRANVISPGSVETKMLRDAFPTMKADFKPQEIARMVLYYASEISSPITGTNIIVQK